MATSIGFYLSILLLILLYIPILFYFTIKFGTMGYYRGKSVVNDDSKEQENI